MANKKDPNKKARQKRYEEASRERFEFQRKKMYLPNMCYFLVTLILFLILMLLDGPSTIFDESSGQFSYMLLMIVAVPLVSLVIVKAATQTMHLLLSITLHALTIIPLIIGYLVKYEDMKNCSSYHMLIIYFMFFIVYVTMTTVFNNVRKKYLNSDEASERK